MSSSGTSLEVLRSESLYVRVLCLPSTLQSFSLYLPQINKQVFPPHCPDTCPLRLHSRLAISTARHKQALLPGNPPVEGVVRPSLSLAPSLSHLSAPSERCRFLASAVRGAAGSAAAVASIAAPARRRVRQHAGEIFTVDDHS